MMDKFLVSMAEAISKFLGLRRFLLNRAMTRLYGLMGCARLMM